MRKIRTGVNGLTVAEMITLGCSIQVALTGNSYFPNAQASLSAFSTTITNAENAQARALKGGKHDRVFRDLKMQELTDMINIIAAAVFVEASGDIEKIVSAGFDVVKAPTHGAQKFTAKNGPISGTVLLTAEAVSGAIHFWQFCADPYTPDGSGWKDYPEGSKSRVFFNSLESGKKYWFREMKIYPGGKTDWTDPISLIIL